MTDLITPELVYFLNTPTQAAFFKTISTALVDQQIMVPAGKEALITREQTFPSGMQLNEVADGLPKLPFRIWKAN